MSLSDVGNSLRDGPFSIGFRLVNLHPTKGTPWVKYFNQNYFDSYGYSLPQNPSKFITKRNGDCLFSEYKIQGLDFFAAFCLYLMYLTKVLGTDFKSASLDLFYQSFFT